MTVCSCLYPLHIVDKRGMDNGHSSDHNIENDEGAIEYLAIPQEVIDEMGGAGEKIRMPKIGMVTEDGVDYVKVAWADPSDAVVKRYDINGHIMVIGCDSQKCKIGKKVRKGIEKSSDSRCKCEEKEVYSVLHPLTEWHAHHIVEIR